MQCTRDSGTIVIIKIADAADNLVDFRLADLSLAHYHLAIYKARAWRPSEIHDYFKEIFFTAEFIEMFANTLG